jgi:hypothetical protein
MTKTALRPVTSLTAVIVSKSIRRTALSPGVRLLIAIREHIDSGQPTPSNVTERVAPLFSVIRATRPDVALTGGLRALPDLSVPAAGGAIHKTAARTGVIHRIVRAIATNLLAATKAR